MNRKEIIRTIYLYLFSLVGLILIVIGSVRLIDLGLKTIFFKNAEQFLSYPEAPRPVMEEPKNKEEETQISKEEEEKFEKSKLDYQKQELQNRREREASNAIAMLIVGIPLFFFHWRTIQRDREK